MEQHKYLAKDLFLTGLVTLTIIIIFIIIYILDKNNNYFASLAQQLYQFLVH